MVDYDIRWAVPADRPAVERIVEAAYTPWIEVIGMRPLPMDADYGALIEANRVYVTGDPVEGLIVLYHDGDSGMVIENVAVDPACQGRGIGRKLMASAEIEADALCAYRIRLYTNELMTKNIALYESLGYEETSRETFPSGHRAVHMTKLLT